MLFPTSFKDKIPKTLSYPIGAQALSEAFADVPQASTLRLHFCLAGDYRWRPPYAKRYIVLRAEYQHRISPPRWWISVYAVPRQERDAVRKKLEAEGLQRMHQWLCVNEGVTGCEGWLLFTLTFDETQQLLEAEEETVYRDPRVMS